MVSEKQKGQNLTATKPMPALGNHEFYSTECLREKGKITVEPWQNYQLHLKLIFGDGSDLPKINNRPWDTAILRCQGCGSSLQAQ
jgi:hypothetical protein